jgi:NADH-quinone oxidoreductase subunit F
MFEHYYIKEFIGCGPYPRFYNLRDAVKMGRNACLKELEKSQLVGRGGAGFLTARKWNFSWDKVDAVLICNGDEGEPGTFKDRYIMENGAFMLLEGMLISAFMLRTSDVFIYIRGEYMESIEAFRRCLDNYKAELDWYRREVDPKLDITVVVGGGAYVCGDETSLINSIEGRRPNSRIKPPYPAEKGLWGRPTIVNNVETLSNLPLIIRDGGKSFASLGGNGSRGTKLISLSGKVKNPGVYEIEMGEISFEEIVDGLGGGTRDGKVKFVIPGGISTQVLAAEELRVKADYGSLNTQGTSFGSGAVIVADSKVDAVNVACNAADFFMRETCGICFPCKEGNRQIHYLLEQIRLGKGEKHYLELIKDVGRTACLAARCGLGQACGNLVGSLIDKFPEDFLRRMSSEESGG